MPIIESAYRAKGLFKEMHFSTIYAAKLRRVFGIKQERKRFELDDGDFVDIDWSFNRTGATKKVVILMHGLEGDAQRPYILGTAKALNNNGFDCAAVNLRGCSGEENVKFRSYHSGETGDMAQVIAVLVDSAEYDEIYLYGVSLGGNVILKYLGERKPNPLIKAAVACSVPIDLYQSLTCLNRKQNWVYRWSFLTGLRAKYKRKMKNHPQLASAKTLKKINSLRNFDDLYTAPAHGFADAMDYYRKSSSKPFLDQITVPALLLNAANDSFLNAACYPFAEAEKNTCLFLEVPEYGGHMGFYKMGKTYYHEQRTVDFFRGLSK